MEAVELNDGVSAPIHGLVLGGGASRRFGRPKVDFQPSGDTLPWGLARLEMLRRLGLPVALSVRPEQALNFPWPEDCLRVDDAWADAGPLAGLLSAWRLRPGVAWMVVACDLAHLSDAIVQVLLHARGPGVLATAFRHPDDGAPEPLCTLYEPQAQPILEKRFAQGRRGLRGFLRHAEEMGSLRLLDSPEADALRSVNKPD